MTRKRSLLGYQDNNIVQGGESEDYAVKKVVLTFSLILVVAILGWTWLQMESPVMLCNSLDHRYSLVVKKRNADSVFGMPGQGSDVRCFVELREVQSQRLIFRGELNMMQEIEEIRWEADMVRISRFKAISYGGIKIGNWDEN